MNKPRLIYFTDVLCGWCFGFSSTMGQLQEQYQDRVDFHVVSGGLFLDAWEKLVKVGAPRLTNGKGDTEFVLGVKPAGRINDVAPHIKAGAYRHVEEATGVTFGKAFLEQLTVGELVLDSLPPAIAICAFREQFPAKTIAFAADLMKAVYVDGVDSRDLDAYAQCAARYGCNESAFRASLDDPTYEQKAILDFEFYRDQPVHGFPSLLLERKRTSTVIFTSSKAYEEINESLDTHLAME